MVIRVVGARFARESIRGETKAALLLIEKCLLKRSTYEHAFCTSQLTTFGTSAAESREVTQLAPPASGAMLAATPGFEAIPSIWNGGFMLRNEFAICCAVAMSSILK